MVSKKITFQAIYKLVTATSLFLASTLLLVACGDGSSSSSDPGTPTTLVNSANGMSPYNCAVNGMCVNPAFGLIPDSPLPANTQFAQSTYPWIKDNTIVISEMPYVSGTVNAKDIDPAGFNLTVTEVTGTNTLGIPGVEYR